MNTRIILCQPDNKGEIVLYQPDSSIRMEVRLENETVWLAQAQIALLYCHTLLTSKLGATLMPRFTEIGYVGFLFLSISVTGFIVLGKYLIGVP
jgi:hypothetical protein